LPPSNGVPPGYQAASSSGQVELDPRGNALPGNPVGAGAGSGVVIWFTPQDYLGIVSQPAGRPDEALIHELAHAVRMTKGVLRPVAVPPKYSMIYDNVEELLAVTIANIYRSEQINRPNLRADHRGHRAMQPPFTDPDNFYLTYQQELDSLFTSMTILFAEVSSVRCRFNPIRSCVKNRLGIQRDSDLVDFGLL